MSTKYSVLEELSGGEVISGEALAQNIGVSRTAVWKAINSLRSDGYIIEASTNSGYQLTSFGNVLSTWSISKHLLNSHEYDIHVYPTIASTNDTLKEWAIKGSKEKTIIISEEQTKGKGRLGRSFSSPSNTGLYMSVLLRPTFSAEKSLGITTAAAVAIAKAIEKLGKNNVQIKWVNDIYIKNRKVCGILTEASMNFETGGLDYAVLGLGVNVFKPDEGFPKEISRIAGAVFSKQKDEVRSKLAAFILNELFEIYDNMENSDYIKDYQSRSYLDGKKVKVSVGNTEKEGIVVGIDDNARLLVQLENGETEVFLAGEALLIKK